MILRTIGKHFSQTTRQLDIQFDKNNRKIISWLQFDQFPFSFIPVVTLDDSNQPDYSMLYCSICKKWISFSGTISNFKRHCSSCSQNFNASRSVSCFKKFIFFNGLPFLLVEDCDLQQILPELPCRQTLISELKKLSDFIDKEIFNYIQYSEFITMTFDEWSDIVGRRFIGFTLLSFNDFNIQKLDLPLVPISTIRCGADEMLIIFEQILQKYNLNNKLKCISSDTCNLMLKLKSLIHSKYKIPWMPCTCHILDLLMEAFMCDDFFNDVFHFHQSWVHSSQLITYLEQKNAPLKKIPKNNSTRWTSFSRIVRALIILMPYIDSFCIENNQERPNTMIYLKLHCIEKLFQKYEKAILDLQSDSFGTISRVIPHLISIFNEVSKLPEFFGSCKAAFNKRFQEKWIIFQPFWYPILYVAAYLNPSITWSLIMNQQTLSDVRMFLIQKMNELQLIGDMLDPQSDDIFHKNIVMPSPLEELELYDALAKRIGNCNSLSEFWRDVKGLPRLGEIAKQILCMQITSAPSERLFSCAGGIMGRKRSKMSSKTLIAATLVRANKSIAKKFLE